MSRAGTQLGFFLVADGFQLNDQSQFQGGQFELRSGDDLTQVASLDDGTPPVLVYVKGDELITVEGVTYLTVNPDPLDPQVNVLNPDGKTHVVSWYDSATGDLVFAIEDKTLVGNGDGDFNDDVFRLHFGAVDRPAAVLRRRGRRRDVQHRDRRRRQHARRAPSCS